MGGRFVAAKLGIIFTYFWLFEPKFKTVGTYVFFSAKSFFGHLSPNDNLGPS